MNYIGNDIISLNDANNLRSFSDERYIRKILTKNEYIIFKEQILFPYIPYLLWTCKESAFKIAMKKGLNNAFVPQDFEIVYLHEDEFSQIHMKTGFIFNGYNKIFLRSKIFSSYISTIACCNFDDLTKAKLWVNKTLNKDHCEQNRERLKMSIALDYNIVLSSISILKTERGIPYLQINQETSLTDISFSHDGEFYSFAYLLNNKRLPDNE
jgi:phosphopantetheinyl transferase (holo-ACP synthase)